MKYFFQTFKTLSILLILIGGVSFTYAAPWTAPSAGFPNNNVDAPINAGGVEQAKTGKLVVNGFGSTGTGFFSTSTFVLPSILTLGVNGKIGATEYCDITGANCSTPPFSGGGGGVGWAALGNNIYNTNIGNVGIKTNAPTSDLQIGSTSAGPTDTPNSLSLGSSYSLTPGITPKLKLWDNGSTVYGLGISGYQLDYIVPGGASHVFYSGGTEEARINSSGNFVVNNNWITPQADVVADTSSNAGITWWTAGPTYYGIYRTSGSWSPNNYQQLRINFDTGIQLGAGTGVGTGYGKSYVEVVSGKGLMVTSGNVGVGTDSVSSGLKLDVEGKVGATEYCDENGANCAGANTGKLPAPAYKSGWISLSQGETHTFTHNLGTIDTVVFIEAFDPNGGKGINISNIGSDLGGADNEGFTWKNKTDSQITVKRATMDNGADQVRVVMWKY